MVEAVFFFIKEDYLSCMTADLFARIATAYQWTSNAQAYPLSSGLINQTWKVCYGIHTVILQRVNQNVFAHPEDIDANLRLILNHFKNNHPDYLIARLQTTSDGNTLLYVNEGFYRVFDYIENSFTTDTVSSANHAFEAAKQFGLFTCNLKTLDASKLNITIPEFHHLPFRYHLFLNACKSSNNDRANQASDLIRTILEKEYLIKKYESFVAHKETHIRVTHHDTKISNVLFSSAGKAICVIDLDTVMPGYYISDVGDMLRTYISPVSEEEKDFSKIIIRKEYIEAVKEGYFSKMGTLLSKWERQHFYDAGAFIIYMQALRFLTDYLLNDRYYGAKYPDQNLVRAANQVHLLNEFIRETKNK